MATIIRYVNTASTAGGDGTTNATSGANRAFATLAAAEAALRQDLTGVACDVADAQGANTIALAIYCTGSAVDTAIVVFNNAAWVTNATHRLGIFGESSGAYWDATKYRIGYGTGYAAAAMRVQTTLHLDLVRMQMESTATLDNSPRALFLDAVTRDVRIYGGFYRQTATTGTPDNPKGILCTPGTGFVQSTKMRNVTAVCASGVAFDPGNTAETTDVLWVYNCTLINRSGSFGSMYTSSPAGADCRIKNVLCQAPITNYSDNNSAPDERVTNLTSDASSSTTALRNKIVQFRDPINWDYRITQTSAAFGVGTNLSADTYWPFSADAAGTLRNDPVWSVGASECTTTLIRYVNTASSAGGTGKTNATTGADRAFVSLQAAVAASAQNLTGILCTVPDEDGNLTIAMDILCSGGADSVNCLIDQAAWQTDATHRLRIRFNGVSSGAKWDNTVYRLYTATNWTYPLSFTVPIHLTLQNLQIDSAQSRDFGAQCVYPLQSAFDLRVIGGFWRQSSSSGTSGIGRAFLIDAGWTAVANVYMRNVTMVTVNGTPYQSSTVGVGAKAYLYNCTLVDRSGADNVVLYAAQDANMEVRIKNCLVQGGVTQSFVGSNLDEGVTILTSDATSPTTALRNQTVAFVDAANWDYRLAPCSLATAVGTSLVNDTYWPFALDAEGHARIGPWSVGADQPITNAKTLVLRG